MKLSNKHFKRARDYLLRQGRPLEQCLFRWFFEGVSSEDILDELAANQAENGGFFGMGEGPDTQPSPIGTTVAFQHLTDIGAKASDKMVQRGIRYFVETYHERYDAWPQEIPDDGFLENALPRYWGNPGGEIVGYLWKYRELVDEKFLRDVTEIAMNNLCNHRSGVPPFCDLCFLRCARFIENHYAAEIIRILIDTVMHHNLERDHSKWDTGYFIKPYWYAETPDSPLYPVLKDEIECALDFDVRTQEEDGSAYLTFPVECDVERRMWKSIWTLKSLCVLKSYNRIEGVE